MLWKTIALRRDYEWEQNPESNSSLKKRRKKGYNTHKYSQEFALFYFYIYILLPQKTVCFCICLFVYYLFTYLFIYLCLKSLLNTTGCLKKIKINLEKGFAMLLPHFILLLLSVTVEFCNWIVISWATTSLQLATTSQENTVISHSIFTEHSKQHPQAERGEK